MFTELLQKIDSKISTLEADAGRLRETRTKVLALESDLKVLEEGGSAKSPAPPAAKPKKKPKKRSAATKPAPAAADTGTSANSSS